MASLRLQRVRELLKREIGEAVRREFHVSDAGLITVNDVDVAGDLKSAVVFVQHPWQRRSTKARLSIAHRTPHSHSNLVARGIVLKYTPALKFVFDDSIVRGNRVLQIIEELEKSMPVGSDPNEQP